MRLRDMPPPLAGGNQGYSRSRDTETFADFLVREIAGCVHLTNLYDKFRGEFRHAVCLTFVLTTLAHLVGHVVRVRAKKQVGRIHASAIIAFVQNVKIFGDGAKVDFVGSAMGAGCSAFPPYLAIASVVQARSPLPAFGLGSRIDVTPENLPNRESTIVTMNESDRLPFDVTRTLVVMLGNWGGLAASAFAKFNRGLARGIMGWHKNLQFLCQAQDVSRVAGHFVLVSTPVIVPQGGA